MKIHYLFIFLLVLTIKVSGQTQDSTKAVVVPPTIPDSAQSTTVIPIKDTVVTPTKIVETTIDSAIKPRETVPVLAAPLSDDTSKKKRVYSCKINKRDSTVYAKMLNIGFGPSFLNLENPLPSYWKNSIGFSVGYTDAITKWLRFNANLDFTNYKIDKSKYLDAYSSNLKKELDSDRSYYTPEKRAADLPAIQNEINATVDTNRNFADKYMSFRNNSLGLLQLSIGLQIRPINKYWIQPYGLFGFNVNLTTNSLVLLKSNFELSERVLTKTRRVYSDALGDSVDESYTENVSQALIKHGGIVFANNSIDGSFGLMFGLGCDVFISPRFGIYGEFRRNVSNKAWKEDYGSFQYGVSTLRFGIKYRIKN